MSPDPGLWLSPAEGPQPAVVATRVAWWEAREASLREHARDKLQSWKDPRHRPAEAHGLLNSYLPLDSLRLDLESLLNSWFAGSFEKLSVKLADSALGRARSWYDLRAWLGSFREAMPSQVLARLGQAEQAHNLVFELFAPRNCGSESGRYPQRLLRLAELCPVGTEIRAWDAGCATGESTWDLAFALAGNGNGRRVEALGTSPWPLEVMMATRRARPHDPARTRSLRALIERGPTEHCTLAFQQGDLLTGAPRGEWDVVTCHGLLGGLISGPNELRSAMEELSRSLKPGGLLSVIDSFREDQSLRAREQVRESAAALGLGELDPGLYRS